MVEKIIEGLYRITVTLPDSPLKSLNSYFIEGIDEDYLVDTGFNRPECEEALTEGLKKIGADRSRISILNTHMHADHTGQDDKYMAEGHHVYMSMPDGEFLKTSFGGLRNKRYQRDKLEGAPEGFFDDNDKKNPSKIYKSGDIREFIVPIADKQILPAKYFDIQTIIVPGHTIGNTMFWISKEGIMLTGDHILFDITPNITAFPGHDDMLGLYLDSLRKSADYPVKLALPGHREPGNYHERIDSILKHHQERMDEMLSLIGNSEKPLTVYELTAIMKWSVRRDPDGKIPTAQLWFAAGECESHIDRLLIENKIVRIEPHDDIPFRTYKLK